MCKVMTLKESARKINIALTDGRVLRSDLYYDDSEAEEGAVNRTKKEYELIVEMLKSAAACQEDIKKWYITKKRENDIIYLSQHSLDRLKERNGWNEKTAIRMMQKVIDNGKRVNELAGSIKTWVQHKIAENDENDDYILYGERLYVFSKNTLVTVLLTPRKGSFYNPSSSKVYNK